MSTIRFDSREVALSNTDKIFFPDVGLSKGDLIDYYRRMAETMVPYMRQRPITMHRFPDGIGADGFYQQKISDYFPDWIERVTVAKEGGEITHVVVDEPATLVYLANQGCITPHIWLSRQDRLHDPDRLIFDLDPPDNDFEPVRFAARKLHDILDEIGLIPFVMTTGSRGLHVVAPLDRQHSFDTVRSFARGLADVLAQRYPERLTTEQRKNKRKGRLFLDTTRNAYAQTSVAPYAVRAKPGAPVATPLDWGELGDSDMHPQRYTIENIFRRMGQKSDPWADIDRHTRNLDPPQEKLERLRQDAT